MWVLVTLLLCCSSLCSTTYLLSSIIHPRPMTNIHAMIIVRKFLIWTFATIGTTVAFTTQYTSSSVGFSHMKHNDDTRRRIIIIKSPMMKTSWSSLKKRKLSYAYDDDSIFSTTTLIEEKEKKLLMSSRIPSPNTKQMSKHQIAFRELLEGILYTPKEIESLLNPNMRSILEGISASYNEHAVYRAFEVLYEDYVPIRLTGRIVYKQFRKIMDESKQYQESQISTVMEQTGMSRSSIEECWSTFIQIVDRRTISHDELQNYIKEPQTVQLILAAFDFSPQHQQSKT
ncbi:hypothetical protein FRACYDRAFT_244655 [Fragilariopsis cylindrus CCMP1102]|uniref:RGS domain-containing protein n=1 Tax=Fragilariopsis cylindrus CCMP1102 TaxID=635003 RepID=A0A1E7F2N0_9STRA|nr:hypothetical protein FRACYDRAFT_244655 [Fragilariopsis cylindrus CCMP1102]|eukprot:OEU12389.1 hypothetical protein FRACYDRAFT_244655 [Fragilariopsis cylindrus CCMP1102]